MKQLFLVFTLALAAFGQSYTEFYCDATSGSNLNGGSNAGAATFTATNGDWNATTGVFTTGSVTGVSTGQYASVYNDGASAPVFVGRVTGSNATTVTVDVSTAFIGTAPTTSATGRSIVVGGAWKCMNAAVTFPFSGTPALTVALAAANTYPRINMLSTAAFSVSGSLTWAATGPIVMQGYTSTPGDGGKFTLTTATGFVNPLSVSGNGLSVIDGIFTMTSTTGTSACLTSNGAGVLIHRVAVRGCRGNGFSSSSVGAILIELEGYDVGKAGTGYGAISMGNIATCIRCYAHDSSSSGTHGFVVGVTGGGGVFIIDSIASGNTGSGIYSGTANHLVVKNSDFYANGVDGITLANTTPYSFYIENNNFFLNAGYGINGSGSAGRNGVMTSNMFGRGTKSNHNGDGSTNYDYTGLNAMQIVNVLTYTADLTPWSAPTTGDFRITGSANKATGRGSFTQVDGTHTGTVSYPDIGSGQGSSAGGGAAGGSHTIIARRLLGRY